MRTNVIRVHRGLLTLVKVKLEQPEGLSAYLHYPETEEFEEVNLNELIGSSQIAVIENKSFYAKLKRDEIPVNAADRLNVVYEDEAGSGDGADDDEYAGEDDDSDDSGGDGEQRAASGTIKETQRTKRPRESGQERLGNAKRTASTNSGGDEGVPRQNSHPLHPNGNGNAVHNTPAGARAAGAAAVTAGDPLADNDMAEAEAFKNSLMSALMHTFSGPPSTMIPTPGGGMIPTPGPAGAGGTAATAHTPLIMIPTPGGAHAGETSGSGRGAAGGSTRSERHGTLRSQNSLPTAGSAGNDEDVRSKVREQLASALQRARDELKAEGYTEALPEPVAVAADVETELYKLHDNSVSKDYKAKFRSLSFNLRDNANPELRARVLRGELPPPKLVTLGPAELARKELSEWRQKRQEEAAKMVFLDAETAAKFSTAAAAALAQSRIKSKEEDAPAAKPTASPERAAAAAISPELPPHARTAGDGATAASVASSSGFPLLGATLGGDASVAAAAAAAVVATATSSELGRRTSAQGIGTGAEGASDGAGGSGVSGSGLPAPLTTLPVGPASTLSPSKRTVLRAALPAAATAGDETPPRADQAGDAPYDPDSYDDPYDPETQHQGDDNMPKYNPFGSSGSSKPSAVPSIASLRAAPSSAAPTSSGPPERQTSLPSPIRSPPAAATGAASASTVVADLAPVIQRQMPGEGPLPDLPLDNVGDALWQGVMRVPGQSSDNLMVIEVAYLGGSGRLGPMLRCSELPSELLVKGQVKLARVEQFFEDLRRSRSRTITLALVRQLNPEVAAAAGFADAAAAAARCGGMAEFVAQHRTRTGLATPQSQLEAYLVTRGPLAARLLKTARVVCPAHQMGMLPEDIEEDQLLLAMVHPRTWEAPPHALIAPVLHHHHQPQQQPQPQPHAHKQLQQEPAVVFPTAEIDFNSLTAAAAAMGLLPPPATAPPPAAPATIDPRLRGPAGPEGVHPMQPPPVVAAAPTAPPPSDTGGGLALDVGALNELAEVLGLAGGAGGKAAAPPVPPEANPPPAVIVEAPGGGAASTQLVTMVMQNPDGTLAIVAVPQGAPPPTASPPSVPAAPPPPQAVLLPPPGPLGQPPIALPCPVPGQPPPPPGSQQGPHPHHEHPPQYLPPGTARPPGPGGPYGEPPPPQVHDHYPGGHGPPPPGRYGGPPPPPPSGPSQGPPGGPAPPPFVDPRAGPPPPPHHGYNPPPHPQDPYYAGQPPPPHHHHHNYQPPPPGHGGSEPGPPPPYGPPRDGPEGRPPPYYPPPREGHDGRGPGGYDDPYYPRGGGGGPPGPHDGPYPPYRGGPPGRGGPPRGEWAAEHGRWGGRRGGGSGGRGRGPQEEGRGGYGYEGYNDRGGRPHDGGGYRGRGRGGGGGRDHGDWAGGERREWEGGRGGDRGGEWGFRERGRGAYGRPDMHHHR
ncbi:hypothetical protein Vretimale_18805 [Volvox reticuliferus]|uniref:TFIIS central domain-containing protein n=1 Tax=Volvox reticuliferus TaxID=1737510 RepID=A0A8J4LYJ9_9CHLO|nr:hypothetical protein Vretimale_18805 [Volvox reticuliferus]